MPLYAPVIVFAPTSNMCSSGARLHAAVSKALTAQLPSGLITDGRIYDIPSIRNVSLAGQIIFREKTKYKQYGFLGRIRGKHPQYTVICSTRRVSAVLLSTLIRSSICCVKSTGNTASPSTRYVKQTPYCQLSRSEFSR